MYVVKATFVCYLALPTVSECNTTVVNTNPSSASICQMKVPTTYKIHYVITVLCLEGLYDEVNVKVKSCCCTTQIIWDSNKIKSQK